MSFKSIDGTVGVDVSFLCLFVVRLVPCVVMSCTNDGQCVGGTGLVLSVLRLKLTVVV